MTVTLTERSRGCLLGGAIGDALGAPVEFVTAPARLDAMMGDAAPVDLSSPLVTDDTQMTMFTAEALIRNWVHWVATGEDWYPSIAHGSYRRWLATQEHPMPQAEYLLDGWLQSDRRLWAARAPGNTCLGSLRSGKAGTLERRINDSMGCGGVMRVAPAGLMLGPESAFYCGCTSAAITHGHDNGIAPAGALAMIISLLTRDCTIAQAVDIAIDHTSHQSYGAETAAILRAARDLAAHPFTRAQMTDALGEGWVGHEALAIAVACSLAWGDDPKTAIWAGANHQGDSDSTASIAGQIVGAAHGLSALPQAWVGSVEMGDTLTRLADVLASIATSTVDPTQLATDFPGR